MFARSGSLRGHRREEGGAHGGHGDADRDHGVRAQHAGGRVRVWLCMCPMHTHTHSNGVSPATSATHPKQRRITFGRAQRGVSLTASQPHSLTASQRGVSLRCRKQLSSPPWLVRRRRMPLRPWRRRRHAPAAPTRRRRAALRARPARGRERTRRSVGSAMGVKALSWYGRPT